MTHRDNISRLHHILDAAEKAVQFTRDRQRCDLDANEMLNLALIRLLEIIGEAVRGVSPDLKERYAGIPWQQMAGMRNNLIHGYFQVDNDMVWETVCQELPPLIPAIKSILEKESKDADA